MGFGVIVVLTSVVSVLNLCCWGIHFWGESDRIQNQIAGALKFALEECFTVEGTTTTTTSITAILVHHWYSVQLFCIGGVVIVVVCTNLFCCLIWRVGWCGPSIGRRSITELPSGEASPVSPLPLEVLARNQLAELRVRRHGAGR